MSASLIGHSGSSAFRLSTATVSMSLAGSCFSSELAPLRLDFFQKPPSPPVAFRDAGAGRQKIFETDPAFRRTSLPRCDRSFRIQKIAAFGGGVKMEFSKSKKGGGGSLDGRIEFKNAPTGSLRLLGRHAPPRPRPAETRQYVSSTADGRRPSMSHWPPC
jgi:hypothetical protein